MSEMELCAKIEGAIMASDLDCLVNALSVNDVRQIAGIIATDLVPTIARLTEERDRLREAVEYADGCFEAALAEGWLDALANHDDYSIDSIWRRRIGMARDKFPAALKEG